MNLPQEQPGAAQPGTAQPDVAGRRRLAGAVAIILAIWCGVLPWIGRTHAVDRHVRRLERQQVDAAAMYYTELHRLPVRPAWIGDRLVLWP
jgi:hypothetical protein